MKKYLFIAIIILVAAIATLSAILTKQIREKNRLKNNFDIEASGRFEEMQTLTKSELKKYHADMVKTLAEHGVKAKQIENIVNIRYHYIDSTIIKDTLIKIYDTTKNRFTKQFEIADKCFSMKGFVYDSNIVIKERSFKDSILISLYKKRKCLFKRPVYKAIAISSCSGDTLQILNNIKIQK